MSAELFIAVLGLLVGVHFTINAKRAADIGRYYARKLGRKDYDERGWYYAALVVGPLIAIGCLLRIVQVLSTPVPP